MKGNNAGRKLAAALSLCIIVHFSAEPACAAVAVTAFQTCEGVEFAGSGTLKTEGGVLTILPFGGVGSTSGAEFLVGAPTAVPVAGFVFDDLSGPSSFGLSSFPVLATSGSGDTFGITSPSIFAGRVLVPGEYLSEAPLSGTSTYAGQTILSLGLIPGEYRWSWGSGSRQTG